MKRPAIVIVSLLALLTAVVAPSDAARRHPKKAGASAAPAGIYVHVVDERGRPVFHARVAIHRMGTRRHTRGRTDRGGNYDSRHPAGSFSISITHSGFLRAATVATLRGGESDRVEVRMLGRHALIAYPHEEHRLGLLHHDLLHKDEHKDDHHTTAHPSASSSALAPHQQLSSLKRP